MKTLLAATIVSSLFTLACTTDPEVPSDDESPVCFDGKCDGSGPSYIDDEIARLARQALSDHSVTRNEALAMTRYLDQKWAAAKANDALDLDDPFAIACSDFVLFLLREHERFDGGAEVEFAVFFDQLRPAEDPDLPVARSMTAAGSRFKYYATSRLSRPARQAMSWIARPSTDLNGSGLSLMKFDDEVMFGGDGSLLSLAELEFSGWYTDYISNAPSALTFGAHALVHRELTTLIERDRDMAGKALPSAGLPTGLYMQEKSGNETVEGRIIYWLNFPTLRVTSSGLEYMEDYQHQEREPRELAIMTKAAALTKASQSNQTVNYAQATRGELTLCYAKPSGTHNCVITFEAADRID